MGMTSYLTIGGGFRQTRITQTYAVVVNAVTLTLLPIGFLKSAQIMTMAQWLPSYMWITPYVLFSINYAVIAYTLISRCFRDAMLVDLQFVIIQLNREMTRTGKRLNSKLRQLFLVKTFTLSYLCLSYFLGIFLYQSLFKLPWSLAWNGFLVNLFLSILILVTYFYFISFWQIARGFDFVNERLEEVISDQSMGSKSQAEEIRSLWALHATLSRTALGINRHYGPQMLASRFDYFIFSIIYGYIGTVSMNYDQTTSMEKFYGALVYWIRSVDFFMNDYICELVTQYQSQPKYFATKGSMSNELSSFLIYDSSTRLELMVCGLYPANRNKWLQMVASIVVYSITLFQFHLVMRNK
ncbi:LOW QUALITY PROTEIN: putative gustatory receptor 59b [Drosophila gunungcola]|uniref:LOW QUALITY PROTEIN: putative gustatory receptor 59b n=1 Tax=Drosophila gunungcola TaxID=103775 RepID=UPI0022E1E399|nr:LOW QUALITY PROTEIN: putative gustatory receptor 59b [Drosophila gunungcola]